MMRFLTDEAFDGGITTALLRLRPGLDLVRVQDEDLLATPDPEILEWAARSGVVLTHDAATMPPFAYARLNTGAAMPGVIVVRRSLPIGRAIEEILTVWSAPPM
ncbi:MAG: DUF5615 family PIN-like protein, partial [Armatimonadetes bacterium]|nr:DUF5615 family PIN-like protein [Armatimonadota bacterium]